MQIRDTLFSDVFLTQQCIEDWENAPSAVQKALTKILRMVGLSGRVPNSLQCHPVERNYCLFIGYVTVSGKHWRILLTWWDDLLIVLRLFDHTTMTAYLRSGAYREDFRDIVEH